MLAPTLAEALAQLRRLLAAPSQRADDMYIERTCEVSWRLADGQLQGPWVTQRGGTALRRAATLFSTDACDRLGLAALTGLPPRQLPPLPLPDPPAPSPLPERLVDTCQGGFEVRWRWRWAAVVRRGAATILDRPPLLEVIDQEGQSSLTTFPPPPTWQPPPQPPQPHGMAPRGRPTLLLAPPAAAALLHEVVGHPLEGDLVMGTQGPCDPRLYLPPLSLPLTVVDDPTRRELPGYFDRDDEGLDGRPRVLVYEGKPVGLLADRTTASRLSVPPGNGRRGGVHAPPRPRLSNLVVSGPATPLAALRAAARVEVTRVRSAALDPTTGLVTLQVRVAWSLRRGERERALPEFCLYAPLTAVLGGLRACSGEGEPSAHPAWCRKDGEAVPVGNVAPWLLVDGLEVV